MTIQKKPHPYWICPSILSANWAHLEQDVCSVLEAGADRIHFDIMDHHYVQNLTFGPKICADLRANGITAPFDVHLMVEPVDSLIRAFGKAKVDCISIHPQTSSDLEASIRLIHEQGALAGLVLNPNEPIDLIIRYLEQIERVLIMSVEPGLGGQAFIPDVLTKTSVLSKLIQKINPVIRLEIDGGINDQTIRLAQESGVDTFVVGSYIFSAHDPHLPLQKLRKTLKA